MSLKEYNLSEMNDLQDVYDREKWLLGEKLGHDPTSAEEINQLNDRMAFLILSGIGEELAKKNKTKL